MSPICEPITSLLTAALASVPLGTNLGLFRGATVCLSGRLLASRGALLPALDDFGLSPAECRQVLSALSHGCWRWEPLLAATEAHIRARPDWQPTQWDGYEPVAVDRTAFPRPRLQGLETSHYDAIARRNLPSVVLGLAVAVGQIRSQPVPVLRVVQERDPADPREAALVQLLLARVAQTLQPAQVAVFDAGFSWGELRQAALPRFVVRLPTNCVFRRRVAASGPRRGRPAHRGPSVRPQRRTYRGQAVPATPPDRAEVWEQDGKTYTARIWDELWSNQDDTTDAEVLPVQVLAIEDPDYPQKPLLLAVYGCRLTGRTAWGLYGARWTVERIPLEAKQVLGGVRQFVSAPRTIQRLPGLLVWCASIAGYWGALAVPRPTGFWDRRPQATAGRLRRALAQTTFADWEQHLPAGFRKKASVTTQLGPSRAYRWRPRAAGAPAGAGARP